MIPAAIYEHNETKMLRMSIKIISTKLIGKSDEKLAKNQRLKVFLPERR
jgi:hypothetical protein